MKILVTAATGNIGRKVVDHLLAAGADDVRALTNAPRRAGLPEQVEAVRANVRRPDTPTAALRRVDRMYLSPPRAGDATPPDGEMVRQLATALGSDLCFVESSHQNTVELLSRSKGENARWYADVLSSAVDGVERTTVARPPRRRASVGVPLCTGTAGLACSTRG